MSENPEAESKSLYKLIQEEIENRGLKQKIREVEKQEGPASRSYCGGDSIEGRRWIELDPPKRRNKSKKGTETTESKNYFAFFFQYPSSIDDKVVFNFEAPRIYSPEGNSFKYEAKTKEAPIPKEEAYEKIVEEFRYGADGQNEREIKTPVTLELSEMVTVYDSSGKEICYYSTEDQEIQVFREHIDEKRDGRKDTYLLQTSEEQLKILEELENMDPHVKNADVIISRLFDLILGSEMKYE